MWIWIIKKNTLLMYCRTEEKAKVVAAVWGTYMNAVLDN